MDFIDNFEQWMTVSGYPHYFVSSFGRVMSFYTKKMLKPQRCTNGYLFVNLWRENTHETKLIHRLVAEAFVSNFENKPVVDHQDGNILNNHCTNLRWATNRENSQNSKKRKNTTSQYKGVCFNKKDKKWQANIRDCEGKKIGLGSFQSEEDAKNAYNEKAVALFGIFARVN